MPPTIFLQAALNGDRIHPAAPRTPTAIAEAARAAVDAGAQSVHVHAFDDAGRETLEGGACAKVLRAIRALCPETPVSLTTSATIVGDPIERFSIVEAWEEMPDLVTANQGEPGIAELCELLLSRGVGIEAGLLTIEDARAFVRSGLAGRCRRVLIEPLDADPDAAVQHAAKMEDIVLSSGITLDQVHLAATRSRPAALEPRAALPAVHFREHSGDTDRPNSASLRIYPAPGRPRSAPTRR